MDKQQIPSEDVANNKEQHYLTRDEMDTLGEMGNISIGTSATTLYSLLGNKVVITTPKVCITTVSKLSELYPLPFVSIEIEYTRGLDGSNLMIIKEEDAKVIADMMLGGDGRGDDLELDELRLSAVGEAMNQMMGSSSTSLSTMLNKVNLANGRKIGSFTDGEEIVKVSFEMQIGDFLKSEIMQLMPISFAKAIVEELHLTMQYDNEELAASPMAKKL